VRRHEPCGAYGERQAHNEPGRHALKRSAQHQLDHPGAVRAERHPNADFVCLLCNHAGRDAVHANGGQHEGDNPEQLCEAGDGPLSIGGVRYRSIPIRSRSARTKELPVVTI
jgi:hypothetical protein